jgi:Carboxypeptidase regulatory-like domain
VTRNTCSLVILIPLCATAVSAQAPSTPPRDVRVHQSGTATITGIVVADDTEARPIRHARVTLGSSEPAIGLTTVTGDDGRFVFAGLPPGRFNIAVAKDGWLPIAYGAKRLHRPGTAVPLAAGQTTRIAVRLSRGAVITGAVFDATGQPAVGATVRAMSYVTTNGERRLAATGSAGIADDRGIYRIYGLAPADYVVGASWRPEYFGTGGNELHLTTEQDVRDAYSSSPPSSATPRSIALASTFYPGTTIPGQAALVTVRSGEERAGIDFTLEIVPTARVEGTLSWPGGSLAPGTLVTLIATDQVVPAGLPFDRYRATGIQSDGSFAFTDIAPGQYTIFARATDMGAAGTPRALWASTDVVIAGENLTGLNLLLAPGLTLSGQVRFDSTSLVPPAELTNVRVTLLPVQTGRAASVAPSAATVDRVGRFTMSGILPGRYTLNASFPGLGAPGGWTLRSAVINGIDALDVPFTAAPNGQTANAIVTFVDRMGQLTGTLQNAGGGPAPEYSIVLFPTSSSFWFPQARRIQSVRPSTDGGFTFRNVPAGEYYLAAAEDMEPGAWFDPAFLQQLVPSSMKIAIDEGEHKAQDIRLGR